MSEPAAPTTIRCPSCEHEVPALSYCVRCGEYLEDDLARHPGGHRGFGAAPNESRFTPSIVSTIFPQLPRAEMDTFRAALGLGVAVLVVLTLVKLFPLAIVTAAVLVPLLVVLYLWEVDLYEDEPLHVLALTIAWGAIAGVGIGLLTKHVSDVSTGLAFRTTNHELFWRGILIPILSVILMLAGPLILLPYRKFNDVLDGATFGGACAVTFVGAELLTHSADFLGLGFRPVGAVVPWVLRVLSLGVALPVLAAGAVGAAAGAMWMRYRAPIRDRNVLGPLGHPFFAIPLAAGLLVGAGLIQLYLRTWWQLGLLALIAILALVWLRLVLHVGLLQEASEIPIGPPIICPNCGRATPKHTFCGSCGVSLQALPKSMRPDRPQAPAPSTEPA